MKQTIFFLLILAVSIHANSQSDSLRKTLNNPVKKTTLSTEVKPATLQQGDKNIAKMPDLKFTALSVTAAAAGTAKYNVSISFTVKNDGTAPVATDDVTLQGYLTDESWISRTQDPKFTGGFTAAGGQILSSIPGKGETLAPGASKQISYTLYNKQLQSSPKPVFLIIASPSSTIKESNTENNKAYTTILL